MPEIVSVPKFNTILDDRARAHYAPAIATLQALCPETIKRKFARANVQQGFMLSAVLALAKDFPRTRILSVGCFEDTAYESLLKMGVSVDGIDPAVNGLNLHDFVEANPDRAASYDIVFSTSVIEHVEDDETFVRQIGDLLAPEGYAILTCDFKESWKSGDSIFASDFRFYRSSDLSKRLLPEMRGCELVDTPDWEQYAPDFELGGIRYNFASFTVRKARR